MNPTKSEKEENDEILLDRMYLTLSPFDIILWSYGIPDFKEISKNKESHCEDACWTCFSNEAICK